MAAATAASRAQRVVIDTTDAPASLQAVNDGCDEDDKDAESKSDDRYKDSPQGAEEESSKPLREEVQK